MSQRNAKPAARLPSLNAVRAFEAVGRLLSFTRAASELNVTPSAISHQVKSLEEFFGVALLRMAGNQIALTTIGEEYLEQVSDALTRLTFATSGVLQSRGARLLRVSLGVGLASCWLIPILDRLNAAFPDVTFSISAAFRRDDVVGGDVDLALRYATGGTPQHIAGRTIDLGDNRIFPICSPAIQGGARPLNKVSDLRHHLLLDTAYDRFGANDRLGTWERWYQMNNIEPAPDSRKLWLNPMNVKLQACEHGLGVGLGRTLLCAVPMAAGRLVCPFGPALSVPGKYYYVRGVDNGNGKLIDDFLGWMVAEAKADIAKITLPDG